MCYRKTEKSSVLKTLPFTGRYKSADTGDSFLKCYEDTSFKPMTMFSFLNNKEKIKAYFQPCVVTLRFCDMSTIL